MVANCPQAKHDTCNCAQGGLLLRLIDRYDIAKNWKENTQVRTYTHACTNARTNEHTHARKRTKKHSDRMKMENTSSDTIQNIAWEISNTEY